jgi:DNA-binding MarR family transcriptional regulator
MGKPRRSRLGHVARKAFTPEASARVDAMCRAVVAGKLATRELGAWVRPVGLGEAEFRLLWTLAGPPKGEAGTPPGQSELAVALAVSPAQVSGLVERLRSQGLIESGSVGGDRRRQAWRLTISGEQAVEIVLNVVAALQIPPLTPPFKGGEFMAEDAA